MPVFLQWQRKSKLLWSQLNPVLVDGVPYLEKDTGKFKIGNGVSRWNDLPYFAPEGSGDPADPVDDVALLAHINDATPHPVYDDGPSLSLLYENAKV